MGEGTSGRNPADVYYDIFPHSGCRYTGDSSDGSPLSEYACSQHKRWYPQMVGSNGSYHRRAGTDRSVVIWRRDRKCSDLICETLPWIYCKFPGIYYVGSCTYVQCSSKWLERRRTADYIWCASAENKSTLSGTSAQISGYSWVCGCCALHYIFPSVYSYIWWTCKREICRLVWLFRFSQPIYSGAVWERSGLSFQTGIYHWSGIHEQYLSDSLKRIQRFPGISETWSCKACQRDGRYRTWIRKRGHDVHGRSLDWYGTVYGRICIYRTGCCSWKCWKWCDPASVQWY